MKGRGWGSKTGLLSGPVAGWPHQGTPANKPMVVKQKKKDMVLSIVLTTDGKATMIPPLVPLPSFLIHQSSLAY